jgi:biotin carboxylase
MIETTRPPGSSGRGQRLAFVYHPRSFGTMSIVEAAEGVCELVWVVDTGIGETQLMVKLLRRLGTVVDVAGMSMDSAASAVAATHPDGVVALSDAMLEWTAQLAQRLGLSFHLPAVAERFTDKLAQRAALREAGVAVPGFWNVPETSDQAAWAQLAEEARFPAVVKPRRSEGSRDTVRVGSLGEVQAIADNTRSGSLILEEYLADRPEAAGRRFADYVSIESIVSEREISHLAITGRFPPAEPFRESGFFIDCELSDEDRSVALELAGAAVTALAVSNGCLHTEIKFTPDGPRVIELNGRIGGGVPEMLSDAAGIALLPIAMRLALGERIVFDRLPTTRRVAYLFYVHAPASMHRVLEIDGLNALSDRPDVAEVIINRGVGQTVDWREGNHGHVFSVRGTVADHDELEAMERRIRAEVTIRGE